MFNTSQVDSWYIETVLSLLRNGRIKPDRTGTGTFSLFGGSVRFDLAEGFPLLSLKKTNWKWAIQEMLWFLRGETNVATLGNPIWNEWATETGEVGPIYGAQWRAWTSGNNVHDQWKAAIELLKKDPFSRRIIVEGWNVDKLPDPTKSPQANVEEGRMTLAPCHKHFQFVVDPNLCGEPSTLNLHLYQRSGDLMLGVPFNITQYAFLLQATAEYLDLKPGILQVSYGDLHIYKNHLDDIGELFRRDIKNIGTVRLHLTGNKSPETMTVDDCRIEGYLPFDYIRFKVAV